MKPHSCRNCGKELFQNQRTCPHCGKESGYDGPEI
ncbi:MAG: zinc-ribbon domain-containing protein [Candidatus Nitrosopumilus sp. Bin_571-38]